MVTSLLWEVGRKVVVSNDFQILASSRARGLGHEEKSKEVNIQFNLL